MSEITIPDRLKDRPRWEGKAIPFTTYINKEDQPEFKVVDKDIIQWCMEEQLCGICGQKLEGVVAFIGGELALQNKLYVDPGMHPECAEYSARVCPFLSLTKRNYAEKPVATNPDMRLEYFDQPRPKKMCIYYCKHYSMEFIHQGKSGFWAAKAGPRHPLHKKINWTIMPESRAETGEKNRLDSNR